MKFIAMRVTIMTLLLYYTQITDTTALFFISNLLAVQRRATAMRAGASCLPRCSSPPIWERQGIRPIFMMGSLWNWTLTNVFLFSPNVYLGSGDGEWHPEWSNSLLHLQFELTADCWQEDGGPLAAGVTLHHFTLKHKPSTQGQHNHLLFEQPVLRQCCTACYMTA